MSDPQWEEEVEVTTTEEQGHWNWPNAVATVAFWLAIAFIAWLIAGSPGVS